MFLYHGRMGRVGNCPYPGFGRIEGDAGKQRRAALLLVHPALYKRMEGTRVQTLFIRFFGYGELVIEI